MTLFLTLSSKNGKSKKGYYGGLSFLDSQADFDLTFGALLYILQENPTHNNTESTSSLLQDYSEKCKLDIFMNLCMWDYVGNNTVDTTLNVQEICRKINTVKQVWNIGRRVCTDTPDELYDKFTCLSVSLPDDATPWSIQLCSCYLSSRTTDLAEAIAS